MMKEGRTATSRITTMHSIAHANDAPFVSAELFNKWDTRLVGAASGLELENSFVTIILCILTFFHLFANIGD